MTNNEKKQLYTVRVAKNDSVTNVEYKDILHVWHQNGVFVLQRGERGKDRDYIYWPMANVDHIHVKEQA